MLLPKKRKEKKREESEASHIKCFGYLYQGSGVYRKTLLPNTPPTTMQKTRPTGLRKIAIKIELTGESDQRDRSQI